MGDAEVVEPFYWEGGREIRNQEIGGGEFGVERLWEGLDAYRWHEERRTDRDEEVAAGYLVHRLPFPTRRLLASEAHRRVLDMSSAISCEIHCNMRTVRPSATEAR